MLQLLVASAGRAEGDLDASVAKVNRSFAARVASVGGRAAQARQMEAAKRIFELALRLDPESFTARRGLLFEQRDGSWTRSSSATAAVEKWSDADPEKAAACSAEVSDLESKRAKEILRLCAGAAEAGRPHLLALLEMLPRHAEVHQALGHERIGEVYARPELAGMARAMPDRLRKWSACGTERARATETSEIFSLKTLKKPVPFVEVGGRLVAGSYFLKDLLALAERTESPYILLRLLLGAEAPLWERRRIYFLHKQSFHAMAEKAFPDPEARKAALRHDTYSLKDGCAFHISDADEAMDLFAHSVAYRTVHALCEGEEKEGVRPAEAGAWLAEGMGYLLTLEMYDRATTYFSSSKESSTKLRGEQPKPFNRTTALSWVRTVHSAGEGTPLHELLGSSINNLDNFESVEAWTFVRFLALFDPAGFQRLPGAIAAEREGGGAARSERGLEKAFGKAPGELERLWRIWLLEIS